MSEENKKGLAPDAKRNLLIVGGIIVVAIAISIMMVGTATPKKIDENVTPADVRVNINGSLSSNNDNTLQSGNMDVLNRDANQKSAAMATQTGASFIPNLPPPAHKNQDAPGQLLNKNSPSGAPMQGNPVDTEKRRDAEKKIADRNAALVSANNEIIKQKMGQYKTIVTAWEDQQQDMIAADSKKDQGGASASGGNSAATATANLPKGKVIVRAGDSAFASIDMSVNTDQPSAVFATILSGPLKGGTLIGKASQNPDDTVGIGFSILSIPNQPQIKVEAEAVDDQTGRGALTGDVNHKIFQRFVLPMFAAAAGAYGQAAMTQGTTFQSSPLTGTMASTNLSPSELRSVALGAGAQNMASTLTANAAAQKPATTLQNNLGVQIRFLGDVSIPTATP